MKHVVITALLLAGPAIRGKTDQYMLKFVKSEA
jgi:predicted methyltransferase